jgi:hypothetical protein
VAARHWCAGCCATSVRSGSCSQWRVAPATAKWHASNTCAAQWGQKGGRESPACTVRAASAACDMHWLSPSQHPHPALSNSRSASFLKPSSLPPPEPALTCAGMCCAWLRLTTCALRRNCAASAALSAGPSRFKSAVAAGAFATIPADSASYTWWSPSGQL